MSPQASIQRLWPLLINLMLLGCSTLPRPQDEVLPAKQPKAMAVKAGAEGPIDVYDPWQGFNRAMYYFNAHFDDYVALPVVRAYERVTPDFIEERISNFFANVSDTRNLLNALLQLKFAVSTRTLARLLINTTVGIGGLWDHATGWGFPPQREDFGQTLGYYGLGAGPYLVLPFFGPSTLRDTVGLVADAAVFYGIDPFAFSEHTGAGAAYTSLNAVDTRHRIEFRYYQTGSPFEYDLVRFFYVRTRRLEIRR